MRAVLVLLVLVSHAAIVSSARAAESIEGSWAYSGGEVLVRATAADEFRGTVVRATGASPCRHAVGEAIWDIKATGEADVYRGGHNYFAAGGCKIASPRGFARWKVGSGVAELCRVPPDDVKSRPTCESLRRVRPPRALPTFARTVLLPGGGDCRRSRSLRIRLRPPAPDPLVSVLVRVDGRRARRVAGDRITVAIVLRRLPRGRYRVQVSARTASGVRLTGSRGYRSCG